MQAIALEPIATDLPARMPFGAIPGRGRAGLHVWLLALSV